MNKIILTGNLVRDPETRALPSGEAVCSFTIAVNKRRRQPGDEPDYYRISVFGKSGENCMRYLAKGRKVAVSGELQPRSYQGKGGQQRISLEVRADEVEFLSAPAQQAPQPDANGFADIDLSDADIPF